MGRAQNAVEIVHPGRFPQIEEPKAEADTRCRTEQAPAEPSPP